jgi:hypothetical protein
VRSQILGGDFFAVTYVVRNDDASVELHHVAHRDWPEWTHDLRNQLYPYANGHQTCEVTNG